MAWTDWKLLDVKVRAWFLRAMSERNFVQLERGWALKRLERPTDFQSVELERGGAVRGFGRSFFVTTFDAHSVGYLVAAGVSQKLEWSECRCTRAIDAKRTGGILLCPTVFINQRWNGHARAVGGTSSWIAVELGGQLTTISAHLPHKG